MLLIYYGQDSGYTTHRALKDIKKALSEQELKELIRFDGYKDSVPTVMEDCSSISLFGEKKTVLFTNCYFLSSTREKKVPFKDSDQHSYQEFLQYLEEPSPDTDLYMVVDGMLDKSSKLGKAIIESAEAKLVSCELPSPADFEMYAYKIAKERNKEIDKEGAKMLVERTKGDYLLFMNNLEKLLTYTDKVRAMDVEELVYQPLEDNAFTLVSSLLQKKTKAALKTYSDLRKGGYDPLMILPTFASQFRFYALVKFLSEKGEDKDSIAAQLSTKTSKVSPGRVYYSLKDSQNLTFMKILSILEDLANMEIHIKHDGDDGDIDLKLFISLFSQKYLNSYR